MARTPSFVESRDVRAWYQGAARLSEYARSIGQHQPDPSYVEAELGLPLHLRFVIESLRKDSGAEVPGDALDSLPFYSLCRGLFLPLSGLSPERVAQFFGIQVAPGECQPDSAAREQLLARFLSRPIGLSLQQKLGCILGDPFQGKPSTFRRDSLLRLLMTVTMSSRRDLLDRLTVVGDVAVLFAEGRPRLREEPQLTAAEALHTLRLIPRIGRNERFQILGSLLTRCGKLEAYFVAKLLLRKAGFGFDYQGSLLARLIAAHFQVDEEKVSHAAALTDLFHVAQALETEGPAALRRIQLKPLSPVKPTLASATDEVKRFPVWVERKYDGIRLMVHKSTDESGAVLCGAYTRNRHDWLELVPGLDLVIKYLPARAAILDGELYGTVMDLDGRRPASVHEVYTALQGERGTPVTLRYAAFDLIYLEGQDLTELPLSERRRRLAMLVAPLAGMQLPVALALSEGQLAQNKEDMNRLYHHFRAQGYEGIIAKQLDGPYLLNTRDPSWVKRKPEITLDLVLIGAVLSVTTKETAGRYGSYVIAARNASGGYDDVGDVAGLDQARDLEIQQEIAREGLMTGRRIERASSSGVRPGYELKPSIVVTVKFEGITRDSAGKRLSLRDPKLVMIRSDKAANEADTVRSIEELYLRQRVG